MDFGKEASADTGCEAGVGEVVEGEEGGGDGGSVESVEGLGWFVVGSVCCGVRRRCTEGGEAGEDFGVC